MNLSMLSVKEILRVCEPTTELENRLLLACRDLDDECDSLRDEIRSCGPQEGDDWESLYEDLRDEARSAISKIEDEEYDDALTILESAI